MAGNRMAETDPTQTLGSKELSLFRSLAKLQEQKQHKKVLKSCDTILKSNPNHGETISFKALTLNATGKKEEAIQLAKEGLMKTKMKSHISWHVLGLIYRSDRNYAEAIKCYRKALTLHDSQQVMRDLGILQIQIRDLKGYCETRKEIFLKRAEQRVNWVGFAVAHHVAGNHDVAMKLIDTTLQNMKDNPREKYEQGEIFMYQAMIMEEAGRVEDALTFLDTCAPKIVDKTSWKEQKARLLVKLGRYADAQPIYQELHDINPECYDYHRGLQSCLLEKEFPTLTGCELPAQDISLSEEQRKCLLDFYNGLVEKDPRPFSYKRIPLDFVSGSEFKVRADQFLRYGLRKGIPSLFSALRPIYKTAFGRRSDDSFFSKGKISSSTEAKKSALARVEALGSIVSEYIQQLKTTGHLPGAAADSEKEAPTVLLWALFYMAQHQDMIGNQEESIKLIDEAIEHTPTLVDLYHAKGRFLKHAGDLIGAAEALEQGRTLDLADKWINSKSAKFHLRAGLIEKGESIVSLFTKHEGDSRGYLIEMQCMWFEIEAGRAFLRADNLAMALKFFGCVAKHFEDFVDDQLDFHSYCLRKMTLRSYIGLLRMEERMLSHRFFAQAAHGSIECHLHIHDNSASFRKSEEDESEPNYAEMTAAERKIAKLKARKAKKKKQENEANSKAAEEQEKKDKEKAVTKKKAGSGPVDDDPDGVKLLEKVVADPLKSAHDLLETVNRYAPNSLQTHLDSFDVEVRRGKYLQAIRAMYRAVNLCSEGFQQPEVFWRLIPFLHYVETGKVTYAPWAGKCTCPEDRNKPVSVDMNASEVLVEVSAIIAKELNVVGSPSSLAKDYFAKYAGSTDGADLAKRVSACKAMLLIDPTSAQSTFASAVVVPPGARFESLEKVCSFLADFGAPDVVVNDYKSKLAKAFPRASDRASASAKEE